MSEAIRKLSDAGAGFGPARLRASRKRSAAPAGWPLLFLREEAFSPEQGQAVFPVQGRGGGRQLPPLADEIRSLKRGLPAGPISRPRCSRQRGFFVCRVRLQACLPQAGIGPATSRHLTGALTSLRLVMK